MNRKERVLRNLGGAVKAEGDKRFTEPFFDGPTAAEQRTSIVLPERLVRAVLKAEVDRLSKDETEVRRFFSHFFDPTLGDPESEREAYVSNFMAAPPRVVLGYPRTTGDLPVFAIVMSLDEEADERGLAKYAGTTLPDENPPGGEDQDYEGGIFNQVLSIYVIAQNPDQCIYLYHFAKFALYGGRETLECGGLIDPSYSGGELNPQEVYLPDNAFGRVLTIRFGVMQTIPKLLRYRDGRRLRLAGIFRNDVVVNGLRGGVKTYTEGDETE